MLHCSIVINSGVYEPDGKFSLLNDCRDPTVKFVIGCFCTLLARFGGGRECQSWSPTSVTNANFFDSTEGLPDSQRAFFAHGKAPWVDHPADPFSTPVGDPA